MSQYRPHCTVSRAMDLLGDPWTLLVLRELMEGECTRAALLRRLPEFSAPALTAHLHHLERNGLTTLTSGAGGEDRYRLTPRGLETRAILDAFGTWGQHWLPAPNLSELDAGVLLDDICRDADRSLLPVAPTVIQVDLLDAVDARRWWLTFCRAAATATDSAPTEPPSVWLRTTLPTLARVWLGHTTWDEATICEAIAVTGDGWAIGALPIWLGRSRHVPVADRASKPSSTAWFQRGQRR